jgi:hypothetical protein
MKYLLTFIVDERVMGNAPPDEMQESLERWRAFDDEAVERGAMIACEPLEESSVATTIHVRGDGDRIVTDGPFAESKEQLGGFALLECEDLDEALEWAGKVPLRQGSIEVRPVMDLSQFGYESRTVAPLNAVR